MVGKEESDGKGMRERRAPIFGSMMPCLTVAAKPMAIVILVLVLLLVSIPVQAYSPPSQVDDLRVYAGESSVELEWGPSWSSSGYNSNWSERYRIYRGTDGGNMTLYATKEFTGFTDLDVVVGTAYRYKIVAFNEYGEGPGRTVDAYPRPAPHITHYFPAQVKDCSQFTATMQWSPPSNATSVVGYRIYASYWMPLNASADTRSVSFELGGWGPHIIRLSAIYADGNESFAETVYIGGPMCEGGFSPLDYLILLLPLFLIAGGALVAVLVILDRRKRR